jgi:hypothetical protein
MNDLKGIGGWLITVAIGVIVNPLYVLNTLSEYPSLFSGEYFQLLSLSSKAFIWGEALFFGVMLLVSVYVAFLFFKKRREFPNWFIGTMLLWIAFFTIDAMVFTLLFPEEPLIELITLIFRQVIQAAIWIPYMFKSERVRLTFVEVKDRKL